MSRLLPKPKRLTDKCVCIGGRERQCYKQHNEAQRQEGAQRKTCRHHSIDVMASSYGVIVPSRFRRSLRRHAGERPPRSPICSQCTAVQFWRKVRARYFSESSLASRGMRSALLGAALLALLATLARAQDTCQTGSFVAQ